MTPTPGLDRARYDRATAHLDAPLAIVDLDAFDANADDLVRRAGGKPVRVASKSVRCRALLERVLARPGFAGVMSYTLAESLWRDAPVDALFPPVLAGPGAGPGGADRTWTRVAVAPDADCAAALAAEWQAAFAGTGCTRVLRASYTDATRSSLVAVGMVFTPGEASAMAGLQGRLGAPPGFGFADERRAAWTASVLPEGPVVVYTVAAFADGRVLDAPVPAEEAVRAGASGAVAQSGLGHEAKAVGELVRGGLRSLAVPAGTAR
ncbi:hypothetical protein EF903_18755 [Streptomyces sp. WAC05292]|nr:hypothetical protein EF903_18755 [Streptomyces sp. WAC05292]